MGHWYGSEEYFDRHKDAKADWIAGAMSPEAARHHLSPVWVKASERLPGKDARYFARYIPSGTRLFLWLSDLQKSPGVYEWLDENNLEHPSSLTGDAVEFAEWIVEKFWRYFPDEKKWYNMVDNTLNPCTTEQLYNLFLSTRSDH